MKFLLIRTAFFCVTFFTFLNSVKILKVPLHFSWLVLFLISLGTWIFWEKFYKKRFPFPVLMAIFFLFQLYADILGNTFKLYGKFIWFDKLTHLTGSATVGAFTIFILSHFNIKNQWKLSPKALIIFAISLALSLGVFYEIFEYFLYSVLDYKLLIIGETDTSDDLFLDLLGAIISVSLLSFILRKEIYFSPSLNDSKIK